MFVTAKRLAGLDPKDRAIFGSTARFLSCLVTESLVRAFYFPLEEFEATGYCVILNNAASSDALRQLFTSKDILAIVPLRHVPLLRRDPASKQFKEVDLLDSLDMAPLVFEVAHDETLPQNNEHANLKQTILAHLSGQQWHIAPEAHLIRSRSTVALWEKYGRSIGLDLMMLAELSKEFASSEKWQQYSYENPRPAPQFSDPSIVWEQSIIEGHSIHPMHKMRLFLPPLPDYEPGESDLYHPSLRLISVPRSELHITYDFEGYVKPLLEAMSKKAGKELKIPEDHVAVPVHEIQVIHIQDKFKSAVIYPEEFSLPLLAQLSIRSLIVPDVFHELSLKLPVGIRLTSAVRTISPASAYLGPRFSRDVVPVITMDHNIVTVAQELASVVHTNPDGDIAKHCSAIIRECHENTSEERGERDIVCTALIGYGHAGEEGDIPAVIRVFELDTEDKRIQWLSKYARMLFDAFLPPALINGVAFECHSQNTIARFDIKTKELKGFIIRDFGGIRIHPETLKSTTGVDADYHEGHSIISQDLDDVYTRMYHTLFHNHLQHFIRVLGLHYNGKGWQIVREQLNATIPKGHPLYAAWLSPDRKTLSGKCLLRMRMAGMYRFHLHGPFPNLIHYRGVEL